MDRQGDAAAAVEAASEARPSAVPSAANALSAVSGGAAGSNGDGSASATGVASAPARRGLFAKAGSRSPRQRAARRLAAAADAERERIEQDIHDGLQQRLTALRIRLALASD